MCCAGGEWVRRRLRHRASLRGEESVQSGGVGGSWGASRGAAWYLGGGGEGFPPTMDLPRRGAAAAAGGMGRLTVSGGPGPEGPLRHGRGGWVHTVPGTGGGWPLVVGEVWGWSARLLPSHKLVLLVLGGWWPGGVRCRAVVVVGVVLVLVVLAVVGMGVRVWPWDSLWIFRSPGWGWGVGHRVQSLGPLNSD